MQKLVNHIRCWLCVTVALALVLLVYGFFTIPDAISQLSDQTDTPSIYTLTPVTVRAPIDRKSKEYDAVVKILHAIPVKRAKLTVQTRRYVVPGGTLFGLRMYTSGVIVVSTEPVETARGSVYPAQEAGLQSGDLILRLNGVDIRSHTQFSDCLSAADGSAVELVILRDGIQKTIRFQAAYSIVYQKYLAGLWVRDSAAGIGTMTFSMPQSGVWAGLGHAVCDVDSGHVLPLYQGDIVAAVVHGVKKGTVGQAGELRGSFQSDTRVGTLLRNDDSGVYGILDQPASDAACVPVALPQEVETGEAQILSTVDESGPQAFSVRIEKVSMRDTQGRNLVLRVTDERLLQTTGGIVQGMSGSPILQNGNLVGAVTHVFVNDPQRGYGIFAQTMADKSALFADVADK